MHTQHRYILTCLLLGLSVVSFATPAAAQRAVSAGSPVTEDFSAYTGTGIVPMPSAGELDSDEWRVAGLSDGDTTFGGSETGGDHGRGASAGGVGGGGLYAFEAGGAGNPALGVQPGGSDFTPGTLELRVQNGTGAALTSLDLAYTLYVLNARPAAARSRCRAWPRRPPRRPTPARSGWARCTPRRSISRPRRSPRATT